MLAWTIYISFLGAAALLALKPDNARGARSVALLATLAGLIVALAGAWQYRPGAGWLTVVDQGWVPQLGIRYHLAVDGISLTLVLLTGFGMDTLRAEIAALLGSSEGACKMRFSRGLATLREELERKGIDR